VKRTGSNCQCGRYNPSFAETCSDCGKILRIEIVLDNMANFFAGGAGRSAQRPGAKKADRWKQTAEDRRFLASVLPDASSGEDAVRNAKAQRKGRSNA